MVQNKTKTFVVDFKRRNEQKVPRFFPGSYKFWRSRTNAKGNHPVVSVEYSVSNSTSKRRILLITGSDST